MPVNMKQVGLFKRFLKLAKTKGTERIIVYENDKYENVFIVIIRVSNKPVVKTEKKIVGPDGQVPVS